LSDLIPEWFFKDLAPDEEPKPRIVNVDRGGGRQKKKDILERQVDREGERSRETEKKEGDREGGRQRRKETERKETEQERDREGGM
jgi:hypothetical protein